MVSRSLVIIIIFVFAHGAAYAADIDAKMFLGPSLGETIILKNSGDGGVTKRTCSFISDSGTYYIEERTRLPKKKIHPKGFPPEIVKIIMGEADLINHYRLYVKDGRLILDSITFKGEKNIMVDFVSRRWSQFGKSPTDKIKIDYVIAKEDKKVVMGKLRNLVHVKYSYDLDGLHYAQSYVLASGLGIIRKRNLSPGPNEVISTLVEE
ncbi:hypothetical protein [Maridesulfovibrio sp.]|uniref:hypothetical protein n=1 Tax=Maridesulfovibrio sp. TaxID=2795000 RepID=UPI0029C9F7B8|nr:hypothetical protein [Maridesulfovibrio sp.]